MLLFLLIDIFFVYLCSVLASLLFGIISASEASRYAPNYKNCKQSAMRIFSMVDLEPVVTSLSESEGNVASSK